jgi:hypothetical protein
MSRRKERERRRRKKSNKKPRNKGVYKENKDRVHDIYGVEGRDRGKKWNCHHYGLFRSEGGGDDKANLASMPVDLHNFIHRGASRKEIHQFCLDHYGGDPYSSHWEEEKQW